MIETGSTGPLRSLRCRKTARPGRRCLRSISANICCIRWTILNIS